MKNFKLYIYTSNSKICVTNSKDISIAATYDETCNLKENNQVEFSCYIAKYITPNEKNYYYDYFNPNNKLQLILYDYNGEIENSFDLLITKCEPTFYKDNEVLKITAQDYATVKFSKQGINLEFDETDNIYRLGIGLLAETGLTNEYKNCYENLWDISLISNEENCVFTEENLTLKNSRFRFVLTPNESMYPGNYSLGFTIDNNLFDQKGVKYIVVYKNKTERITYNLNGNYINIDFEINNNRDSVDFIIYLMADNLSFYNDKQLTNEQKELLGTDWISNLLTDPANKENLLAIKQKLKTIDYNEETDYIVDDLIKYKDLYYVCIKEVKSIAPDATNGSDYWNEYSDTQVLEKIDIILSDKSVEEVLEVLSYPSRAILGASASDYDLVINTAPIYDINLYREPIFRTKETDYYGSIFNKLLGNEDNILFGLTTSEKIDGKEIKYNLSVSPLETYEEEKYDEHDHWKINKGCLENFTNLKNNKYYYQKATLELSSSNLYNGLVELALLFNAELNFNYDEKIITFINKQDRTYNGVVFTPDLNINSLTRAQDGSNLVTALSIYGKENDDETINMIQDIPSSLQSIILEDSGIVNAAAADYSHTSSSFDNIIYKIENKLLDTEDTDEKEEIQTLLNVLTLIPNYENKSYNLTYFWRIGLITQDQLTIFNNIIKNELRSINMNLSIKTYEELTQQATLSLLENNYLEICKTIISTEQQINTLQYERNVLFAEYSDSSTTEKRKEEIESDLLGYDQDLYNAKKLLEEYEEKWKNILYVSSENLKNTLIALKGYYSPNINPFNTKVREFKKEITLASQELEEYKQQYKNYYELLKDTNIQASIEASMAGIITNIKNRYDKLGMTETTYNNINNLSNYAKMIYNMWADGEPTLENIKNIGRKRVANTNGITELKEEPSNDSETLHTLKDNTIVTIIYSLIVDNITWYYVSYDESNGYIISTSLDNIKYTYACSNTDLIEKDKFILNLILTNTENVSLYKLFYNYSTNLTENNSILLKYFSQINTLYNNLNNAIDEEKYTYYENLVNNIQELKEKLSEENKNSENNTNLSIYNSDITYEIGDVVKYNNLYYICIKKSKGITPTEEVGSNYWISYETTLLQRLSLCNNYQEEVEEINNTYDDYTKKLSYSTEVASIFESYEKYGTYEGTFILQQKGYNDLLNKENYNKCYGLEDLIENYFAVDENQEYINYHYLKDQILCRLQEEYGEYIIEGYYEDSDSTDYESLLENVLKIYNTIYYPTVTYDISIIDLSQLENYEELKINVGDLIKIDDKFTIEYKNALSSNLEIQEIDYNLRKPGDTKLIVDRTEVENRILQNMYKNIIKALT